MSSIRIGRRCIAGGMLAALMCAALPALAADDWPSRPITLVVPGAAGGSTDIPARILAQKLSERLGQSVIVENRPGAGGMLGANHVAQSSPDGYTVLVGNTGSNAINYTTYKKISYGPEDFVALTDMISFSNVLVVPQSSPIHSLDELLQAARKAAGSLSFSSAGVGQTTHLMGELLRERTGIDVVHVPYKGSAPATLAIVSGETQFMFDNLTASLAHIKAGRLRPLAVTSAEREAALPQVSTTTELGLQDFDKVGWMGFFLPARTPAERVQKLTENLIAILHDPEVRRQYTELGGRPGGMPQEQFAALVDTDRKAWGELITSRGLQLD